MQSQQHCVAFRIYSVLQMNILYRSQSWSRYSISFRVTKYIIVIVVMSFEYAARFVKICAMSWQINTEQQVGNKLQAQFLLSQLHFNNKCYI